MPRSAARGATAARSRRNRRKGGTEGDTAGADRPARFWERWEGRDQDATHTIRPLPDLVVAWRLASPAAADGQSLDDCAGVEPAIPTGASCDQPSASLSDNGREQGESNDELAGLGTSDEQVAGGNGAVIDCEGSEQAAAGRDAPPDPADGDSDYGESPEETGGSDGHDAPVGTDGGANDDGPADGSDAAAGDDEAETGTDPGGVGEGDPHGNVGEPRDAISVPGGGASEPNEDVDPNPDGSAGDQTAEANIADRAVETGGEPDSDAAQAIDGESPPTTESRPQPVSWVSRMPPAEASRMAVPRTAIPLWRPSLTNWRAAPTANQTTPRAG